MKDKYRPALSLFLGIALMLSLMVPGVAVSDTAKGHADILRELGLFRGVGTGPDGSPVYDLEKSPDRLQGLVMLIRLLGRESEALASGDINPFVDVNQDHGAYGIPYVAYAYAQGLTRGSSSTTFDPETPLSTRDYVTFLLRALGYSDAAGDFSWTEALNFAASIGLLQGGGPVGLDRGDMVDLSYAALLHPVKGEEKTLAQTLCDRGVFTREQGEAAGVLSTLGQTEPVTYALQTVATSRGELRANVITVDLSDPRVRVRAALVDGTLGHTANFQTIAETSGCVAAVNGNFFTSGQNFKRPLGHVMTEGAFRYVNAGFSSLGIYRDGHAAIGRLPIFTRISASNGYTWAAYEINTVDGQGEAASVLYLPSYGQPVAITSGGSVMVVRNNVVTEWRDVSVGELCEIPADGFLLFAGPLFMAEEWNHEPLLGSAVTGIEPYLFLPTEDSFALDGVVNIVSGGPRLVTKGQMDQTMEGVYSDTSRFGPNAASPRTAVGLKPDGTLLLVTVPGGATIQQMRELMLSLGCQDAFNLDGGASCGMYYRGMLLATPGRQLTTTLQVFLEE